MKKQKLIPLLSLTAVAALSILLFYIYRGDADAMRFARDTLSGSYRAALGWLTARVPFSVTETGLTALGIFLLYRLVKTVVLLVRRTGRAALLLRRVFPVTLAGLCCWSLFLWVWSANYYAPPPYEGVLLGEGVTLETLTRAAEYFRDGANAYAGKISRDADGHYAEDLAATLARLPNVYAAAEQEFPSLGTTSARVKPMLYSELMSRLQFTGVYFPFTGEPNVNARSPAALLPATAAHELAHAHGVARENEADFFGVAACVTSGDPVYEYSGYLMGMIALGNALYRADADAYFALAAGYSDPVRQDLRDNSDYWAQYAETPAVAAVSAMYDTFLKSNGQTLGIQSYGKCADLLAEWAAARLAISSVP